jgi:hypothetical protein
MVAAAAPARLSRTLLGKIVMLPYNRCQACDLKVRVVDLN